MAEATKTKVEKFLKLLKFWAMPPVNLKAKDGSGRKITVEHCVGREVMMTIEEIMDKTGLAKELLARSIKLEKKFDPKNFEEFFKAIHRKYIGTVHNWHRSTRSFLFRFYEPQRFFPIYNFGYTEPFVQGKKNKKHLFIQGLVDSRSLTPIYWEELNDLVSALEHKNAHLKQMVDEYNMNRQIARNMMSLPGVNKDIQHRLNNVATGAIDRQMLLEQRKDEDEGEAGAAAKKK